VKEGETSSESVVWVVLVHEAHMDRTTFASCLGGELCCLLLFFFLCILSVQLLFALSSYAGFLAWVPMVEVESREGTYELKCGPHPRLWIFQRLPLSCRPIIL
jgi:hypothetical protein